MGWSNLLKTGGKGVIRLLEGTGKGVGTAAKGLGEGMGATAKGLGGWKGVVGSGAVISAVNSEHGLAGVASDVMFGQGGSEKVQEHGVAGEALNIAIGQKGKEAVSEATDAVSQQVSNISAQNQANDGYQQQVPMQQSGIGSFMSQATTNPLDMGGNFLNNLMTGNVSTMSMAAMIASSFLVFGRFGLFTKALGALLGIHTIGKNSQPAYMQRVQPVQPVYQQSPVAPQVEVPSQEVEVVERSRGFGR